MRKSFLAALMATIAAFPVTAQAQDAPGERQERRQYDSDGGPARRYDPAVEAVLNPPAEAARPQAPREARVAQAQGERGRRFDSGDQRGDRQNRGDRGDRGSWNRNVQQPQVVQPLPQQNRIDRAERRRDNDGVRGDSRRFDRSPGVTQQQDRNWNNDRGRNWNNDRDRNWNGNRSWNDNRGWNGNDRRYSQGRNWNRNWRQDNRYNWQGFRSSNRNAFRLPRYYAPYGWNRGYQRFSIGAYLGASLFARNYWIDDPYSYRLPDVDWPYQWVRYYNDALLVDTESGEVVDVISDIFW